MAITQLMAAAAWDDATLLLGEHAGHFLAQGRTASIRDWILALPKALQQRPALHYWHGVCKLGSDPALALDELKRARHGFDAVGDTAGLFQTAAAAADAIVFLGNRLDVLEPWVVILGAHAPAYLAQRLVRPDIDLDLRVLPGLLGVAVAATQNGRFDLAAVMLQEAVAHPFHAVCTWHHWIEALVEAHLADSQGDLPRCLNALRRALCRVPGTWVRLRPSAVLLWQHDVQIVWAGNGPGPSAFAALGILLLRATGNRWRSHARRTANHWIY